jgi:hypothetical protein
MTGYGKGMVAGRATVLKMDMLSIQLTKGCTASV